MDLYPKDFPTERRKRVNSEIREAKMELQRTLEDQARRWEIDVKKMNDWGYEYVFLEYISRGGLAFAREACELMKKGRWSVERVRAEVEEFLCRFVREFERRRDKADPERPRLTSRWNGRLLPQVETSIFTSHKAEWLEYEDELDAASASQPRRLSGWLKDLFRKNPYPVGHPRHLIFQEALDETNLEVMAIEVECSRILGEWSEKLPPKADQDARIKWYVGFRTAIYDVFGNWWIELTDRKQWWPIHPDLQSFYLYAAWLDQNAEPAILLPPGYFDDLSDVPKDELIAAVRNSLLERKTYWKREYEKRAQAAHKAQRSSNQPPVVALQRDAVASPGDHTSNRQIAETPVSEPGQPKGPGRPGTTHTRKLAALKKHKAALDDGLSRIEANRIAASFML
jgi:hypothetical protein